MQHGCSSHGERKESGRRSHAAPDGHAVGVEAIMGFAITDMAITGAAGSSQARDVLEEQEQEEADEARREAEALRWMEQQEATRPVEPLRRR